MRKISRIKIYSSLKDSTFLSQLNLLKNEDQNENRAWERGKAIRSFISLNCHK